MNKGAQDAAKASGKDLVIFNSNDNPVAQNDAIENYIQQGVKGILVAAIDVNGIMPAVKEAAAANIPVIAIDAVLPAGPQAAQVGVDNIEGGRIIGQYFVDYVQKRWEARRGWYCRRPELGDSEPAAERVRRDAEKQSEDYHR